MSLELPASLDGLLRYFIQPTASVVFLRGGNLVDHPATLRSIAPVRPVLDPRRWVKS